MNKSALVTACGDPFILLFLVQLFQKHWYDEVDKMYININNHVKISSEVIGELIARLVKEPKVHLIYHPEGLGNGPPFTELLKVVKEDLVLLLEDDFYIFTSGVVSGYFQLIESGEIDLLGSPRYSVGEVAEAAKKKYRLDYSGEGDRGFGWWPTGFYCKREDLFKTDLDFGSKKYPKGEYFKELDYTFSGDDYTDTFTWTSLQLRYLGLKDLSIPQYHASPTEPEDKEKGVMNWPEYCPPSYLHAGSLSAGWGGYLSGRTPDLSHEMAKREMETRVAFWYMASDEVKGFEHFKVDYREGIDNLAKKLDSKRIDQKYNLYRELMKL